MDSTQIAQSIHWQPCHRLNRPPALRRISLRSTAWGFYGDGHLIAETVNQSIVHTYNLGRTRSETADRVYALFNQFVGGPSAAQSRLVERLLDLLYASETNAFSRMGPRMPDHAGRNRTERAR